jgi:tetratricopeptide (TPR) repeat protein
MSQPVTARGQMRAMISVFDSLAWKLTRQMDPGFSVAEETFLAAGSGLRLNAFEQYIRGITDSDQAERLRHQNAAVKLSPEFSPAWMALGREQYASKQYEQAAEAFAKVDRNGADALEAGFYRGLSLLFSGDYARAEEAFASVARVLPLAEVMNNQGVALARQGKDGTPLFRQATAADPNGADYHFNLAVSLKRRNHDAEALVEMTHCLRLHSNDSEAQALQKVWKASASASAGALDSGADEETGNRVDALERIERGFDAVAFRQAASVMDQMNEARVAALPPRERAQKLSARAKDYLDRGLLLEAERLDQAALAADPKAAAAHAGLAEIRERTGDDAAARKEARMALGFEPSADAFLVLGRLDLAAGHLSEASKEAGEALKLAPASRPARDLRQQIEARQIQKK